MGVEAEVTPLRLRRARTVVRVVVASLTVQVTLILRVVLDFSTLHLTVAFLPGAPCGPVAPVAPVSPLVPFVPVDPVAPVAPAAPAAPAGPEDCAITVSAALVADVQTFSSE